MVTLSYRQPYLLLSHICIGGMAWNRAGTARDSSPRAQAVWTGREEEHDMEDSHVLLDATLWADNL